MTTTYLNTKIKHLPNELQKELNSYVDYLLTKAKAKSEKKQPVFGSGKGKIALSQDFDEALDDFNEYQ
jgi:Protein of unknown function (DUF2281)